MKNSLNMLRANGEEALIQCYDGRFVEILYSGASEVPEKISINELYENFALNYCVTVHKSQGSTYNNVIIIEDDILSVKPITNIEKSQSIYVALTRASEKVYVVSELNK